MASVAAGAGTGAAAAAGLQSAFLDVTADAIDGGWTNETGGTVLYASIDEHLIPVDTDFIRSSQAPSSDVCKVALGAPAAGTVAQPFGVSYRYGKIGVPGLSLQVRLLQGATQIASWYDANVSSAFATVRQVLTTPQFNLITDFTNLFLEFTAAVYDASTTAWVSAVIANGGTVSPARQALVNALITGLKSDGVWSKMDRISFYASENTPSALVDTVNNVLSTPYNSPIFTVDRGFTGDGSSAYIDTGFNPTIGVNQYTQDSASFFAWSNTSGADAHPICGASAGGSVTVNPNIYPEYTDTHTYFGINDEQESTTTADTGGAVGLYIINRTSSTTSDLYFNGTKVGTTLPNPTVALVNNTFYALGGPATRFSSRQLCALGLGGALTATDASNLYNRLRAYMTAVGVP